MRRTLLNHFHEHTPDSATPDKASTVAVFRTSLLFKTGVDCWTVLDVSSTFVPWALLPGRVDHCTYHQKVTCESSKTAATAALYIIRNIQ